MSRISTRATLTKTVGMIRKTSPFRLTMTRPLRRLYVTLVGLNRAYGEDIYNYKMTTFNTWNHCVHVTAHAFSKWEYELGRRAAKREKDIMWYSCIGGHPREGRLRIVHLL